MKLIWFGQVWYWGINSKNFMGSGCKYGMDDKKFFDIHVESPGYDLTNSRFVSIMLNVRGNQPDVIPQIWDIELNPTPLYKRLNEIEFDVNSVVLLETEDFTDWRMHDCVWLHYFDLRGIPGNIQIVPNILNKIITLHKSHRGFIRRLLEVI